MIRTPALAAAVAVLGLAACNKTDTVPRPEHSEVATAMPDAASTPGAVGPATAAPHDTPPLAATALTPPASASNAGPSPHAGPQDLPR